MNCGLIPDICAHDQRSCGALGTRIDMADDGSLGNQWESVVATEPLGRRSVNFPSVIEIPDGSRDGPVINDRVERRYEQR